MDLGLRGKAAVVSGSTAGIGLAIATALAAEGAKVVNGRTEARVAAALDKIRQRVANAELRGVAADLGTANGVDAFLKQVAEADILVNNLCIFEAKPFAEISDADKDSRLTEPFFHCCTPDIFTTHLFKVSIVAHST